MAPTMNPKWIVVHATHSIGWYKLTAPEYPDFHAEIADALLYQAEPLVLGTLKNLGHDTTNMRIQTIIKETK
jgi:hypothetical protein